MKIKEKIQHLSYILNQPVENYSDSFKADIIMYFDNDFSEGNKQFQFLNNLNSKEAIQNWTEIFLSKFVLKFNPKEETENDFIHFHMEPQQPNS